ncbi:MAG: zinc-ribbon and DUF3426 domain-containing protein [Granulosicoccus sp.]
MSNGSNKHDPLLPDSGVKDDGSEGTLPEKSAADSYASNLKQEYHITQGAAQPQTRCTNCQTVFEVSPELLVSNDTRVRCGECLSIFDALINLRQDIPPVSDDNPVAIEAGDAASTGEYHDRADATASELNPVYGVDTALADARGNASVLDVTYSDFDLFSGEAGLPDVAYFDQTQDLDSLRFDEPDGDETFSDTLFAHDMTVEATEQDSQEELQSPALAPSALDAKVDFVTDDVQSDPVVFTYRDPDAEEPEHKLFDRVGDPVLSDSPDDLDLTTMPSQRSSGPWTVRILLAILAMVIAAGLYGYRSQDALMQNPELRPWIVKACTFIGCEVSPRIDLDAMQQLKRTVFAHPTNKNALVIDLAFMNGAAFDQPYPVLQIRLTNRNGELVVQNNVTPSEYLDDWQPDDLLAAGQRLDLSLTFEDPGQTATYAVLNFL